MAKRKITISENGLKSYSSSGAIYRHSLTPEKKDLASKGIFADRASAGAYYYALATDKSKNPSNMLSDAEKAEAKEMLLSNPSIIIAYRKRIKDYVKEKRSRATATYGRSMKNWMAWHLASNSEYADKDIFALTELLKESKERRSSGVRKTVGKSGG